MQPFKESSSQLAISFAVLAAPFTFFPYTSSRYSVCHSSLRDTLVKLYIAIIETSFNNFLYFSSLSRISG